MMGHLWHSIKLAFGMMGKGKAFTGPLWVQIGIANPCNHRCIMCWDHPSYVPKDSPYPDEMSRMFYKEHPEIKRNIGFMDLDMLENLADDLHLLGTKRIELAGRGEPTLHPKFEQMVQTLKDRGFHVGVATNGSLLSSKRCRHLVRQGVERIVVSLNAATRETYPCIHITETPDTYDKIIRNSKTLQAIKKRHHSKIPRIMLSFVISRLNYQEGFSMIERIHDVGADEVVFKYAITYPNIRFIELTDEEKREFSGQLPAFLQRAESYGIDLKVEPPIGDMTAGPSLYHKKTKTIYSKIPCYIGWYFALITAEGTVSPCCQCMLQMGNLKHQRFREVWSSQHYSAFREKMKRISERKGNPPNCSCDECSFDKINTTIYNRLHFYNPIVCMVDNANLL
ncbi:MAG: radical SAM protein [Promethearchaeota archaeon]|jgi:MoaA/NifB/PqqE/SkfB family radical SAM enzyme